LDARAAKEAVSTRTFFDQRSIHVGCSRAPRSSGASAKGEARRQRVEAAPVAAAASSSSVRVTSPFELAIFRAMSSVTGARMLK
jgi:hypothetical protein